jgi:hypothetical protein
MLTHEDVVTVLGRRGWGKTSLSRILQNPFFTGRVVIIDRMREYSNLVRADFAASFHSFCELLKKHEDSSSCLIIYQVGTDEEEIEFNEALRCIYHFGDCLLVIEEIHHFASPHSMPSQLREILLTGRHRGIALLSTSQRPGEVHKTILSQSSHVFAGSIHETNDLKYLSSFLGKDAEMLRVLKKIPQRGAEFVHFRLDGSDAPPQKIFVEYGKNGKVQNKNST